MLADELMEWGAKPNEALLVSVMRTSQATQENYYLQVLIDDRA